MDLLRPPPTSTSVEERYARPISPLSQRSAPSHTRGTSRPRSRQRARRRSVDAELGLLAAASSSSSALLTIPGADAFPDALALDLPPPYTPPERPHAVSAPPTQGPSNDPGGPAPESRSHPPAPDPVTGPPPLEPRPDSPGRSSVASSTSALEDGYGGEDDGRNFQEAWERDREAGFSLEERVKRDFERRDVGLSKHETVTSDEPVVDEAQVEDEALPEEGQSSPVEPDTEVPVAESSSQAQDEQIPASKAAPAPLTPPPSQEVDREPSSPLIPPTHSRPLPRPPPVLSRRPTSAYVAIFHALPPVSPSKSAAFTFTSGPEPLPIGSDSNPQHTPAQESVTQPDTNSTSAISLTIDRPEALPLHNIPLIPTIPGPVSVPQVSCHAIQNPSVVDQEDSSVPPTSASSPPKHDRSHLPISASEQIASAEIGPPQESPASSSTLPSSRSTVPPSLPPRRPPPPPIPPKRRDLFSTFTRPDLPPRPRNSPPSAFPQSPTSASSAEALGTTSDVTRDEGPALSSATSVPAGAPLSIRDRIDRLEAMSTRRRPPPPPPPRRLATRGWTQPQEVEALGVSAPTSLTAGPNSPTTRFGVRASADSVDDLESAQASRPQSAHPNSDSGQNTTIVQAPVPDSVLNHAPITSSSTPSFDAELPPLASSPLRDIATMSPAQPEPRADSAHVPPDPEADATASGASIPRAVSFEYTDLDLLVARLDNQQALEQGNGYDDLLVLSEIIGPALPSSSTSATVQDRTQRIIEDLPVAPVQIERRRVTKDGRTKLKLSLMGVMVDRCSVCMSQFKKEEMGVLLPCQHS